MSNNNLMENNFTFYPTKDQDIFMNYFITQYPHIFKDRSSFVRFSMNMLINYLKTLEIKSDDQDLNNLLENPLETFSLELFDFIKKKKKSEGCNPSLNFS